MQESKGLDLDELSRNLQPFGIGRSAIAALIDTFANAKTFGSLIQIPDALDASLPKIGESLISARDKGDVFARLAADDLIGLLSQALVLSMKFDAVVANPPYMGGKGMNPALKGYAENSFPDSKSDLFSMFMERGFDWCKLSGFNSMVTMQSWMFLSSYDAIREKLLQHRTIQTMAHLGARAFAEISGEVVQTTAFVLQAQHISGFKPVFFRLVNGQEADKESLLRQNKNRFDTTLQDDFKQIPGSPMAYWIGNRLRSIFSEAKPLDQFAPIGKGLDTGNNKMFLRLWHEVDVNNEKWVPCLKGGSYRKWYGNFEYKINWDADGSELKSYTGSNLRNEQHYFKSGLTWSRISSGQPSFRHFENDCIPESTGPCIFLSGALRNYISGFVNSNAALEILKFIAPTLDFQSGHISKLPIFVDVNSSAFSEVEALVDKCVSLSMLDWDLNEVSWDFSSLGNLINEKSLESSWYLWRDQTIDNRKILRATEIRINEIFVSLYGLESEVGVDVSEEQITLIKADRRNDCQRLISYSIGCIMGRYSLDEAGLIYANAGNVGFDAARYKTFPADDDGIVPVTDELWFEDDAANRVREFLMAVWGSDSLDENMTWLAVSLGQKANETPEETIRRYISSGFYKDHLQTYKKRPIYWLFSSGKQGAFQCLVYLHRYHEGTLSRMRAEYVVPLTAKIAARIDLMNNDAEAASSAAARTKINKQIEVLRKKQTELLAFDEKLRHYADMRIKLDLDDGVKVNYGKFGDLLDSVKAITGGGGDD